MSTQGIPTKGFKKVKHSWKIFDQQPIFVKEQVWNFPVNTTVSEKIYSEDDLETIEIIMNRNKIRAAKDTEAVYGADHPQSYTSLYGA